MVVAIFFTVLISSRKKMYKDTGKYFLIKSGVYFLLHIHHLSKQIDILILIECKYYKLYNLTTPRATVKIWFSER